MVAAHQGDLDAAAALGFQTASVHRPAELGPGCTVAIPSRVSADFSAGNLEDPADQLGC